MAGAESGGAARFSCPPNFAALPPTSEHPRLSLEALMGPDTELWIIRAPLDFTPDCLNGRLVPLSGLQTVKGKLAGKRQRFRVLGSSGPPAEEATLLAPSAEAKGELTCAPTPQGRLRIFEGPQASLSGACLQPIPASPSPQIPLGLRPRFCAFGGSPPIIGPCSALTQKTPTSGKRKKKRQVPQEPVNGAGILEVDAALESPEMGLGKKKKKQQLKEFEVTMTEPLGTGPAEMLGTSGVPGPSSTKKRKKQPRGAEVVELETGLPEPEANSVKPELVIKTEPLEETVLSPTKKRKRQKGTEGMEPVERVKEESPLRVKVEPHEQSIPLPLVKKKKKEKRSKVMAEPATEVAEPDGRPVELGEEMGMEAEPPRDLEPLAEAALAYTKKRRKKEKWQKATVEPGAEPQDAREPKGPGDTEPQVALAPTKKRKKERGSRVAEPGAEVTEPQREMMETELDEEALATPASTQKKKKKP